jgi:hypothetical protein
MYTNIKTFEDACKVLNLDPSTTLPDVSMLPEIHQKAITAHCKLVLIAQALNLNQDGSQWKPDWDDDDQFKYYPWFVMGSSGFRFIDYVLYYGSSDAGSRLCFRDSEVAQYAGEQFQELYSDYFLL